MKGLPLMQEALCLKEAGGERAYDSFMIVQRTNIQNNKPIVPAGAMSMKDINWDVYPKGAFLMHTLRYVLGDSIFFPALKTLSTDQVFPYERNFTSEDIEKHFSKAAGKDLKPLFDFYLKTNKTIGIGLYKSNT